MVLAELKGEQQAGGKRIVLALMEGVRAEIEFARRSTEQPEFQKAIGHLSEAISLVESSQPGPAGLRVSEAISAVTTPAQNAWQVLTGMDSSEFREFLRSRSSVREFAPDPVPENRSGGSSPAPPRPPAPGIWRRGTWWR